MVDPQNVTDYQRTDAELEEFLIFCIAVAGKSAMTTAPKVHTFCHNLTHGRSIGPLEAIVQLGREDHWDWVDEFMHDVRLGKYSLMLKAFKAIEPIYEALDLHVVSPERLEEIPGVGMKTSRFFVLHSQRNPEPVAVLDTHILKFLNHTYHILNAPLTTPSGRRLYKNYERTFLETYADYVHKGFKGTLAEFDLLIWVYYNNKLGDTEPIESFLMNAQSQPYMDPITNTQKGGVYDIRS